MDRHGKLLGKKMQGTYGATTNHIPARDPAVPASSAYCGMVWLYRHAKPCAF